MRRSVFLLLIPVLVVLSCAGPRRSISNKPVKKVVTRRVAPGETWESLAERFYGDKALDADLASYNGLDPSVEPEPGSGVRIPLTARDLKRLGDKSEAAAAYNRGLDMASSGNFAGAIDKFREAVEIDPSLLDASFNLGVVYQKLGLHSNAATVFEGLIVKEKENPEYYYALGASLFHLERYEKAYEAFHEALEIDRMHLKSLFSIAVVCERSGKTQEAAGYWRRYIQSAPEGEWREEARRRLEALNE